MAIKATNTAATKPAAAMEPRDIDRSILNFDDSGIRPVEVPEWNGTIHIKRISVDERIQYIEAMESAAQKSETTSGIPKGVQELLLVFACVKRDGSHIFGLQDMQRLSQKSSIAVSRIFAAAAELNGLTGQEFDETVKK